MRSAIASTYRNLRRWITGPLLLGAGACVLLAGPAVVDAGDSKPVLLPPHRVESSLPSEDALRRLALEGDPAANFEYGLRHLEGKGVPRNMALALQYLSVAARGGVAKASFRLGKLYYDGTDLPVDYALALEHYTVAARAGVSEAQHNLGVMLVSARGVKRDYVEGLAWLILATKSGASADGEKQVRQRLQKYPAQIRAAELRAEELVKDLARAVVRAELTEAAKPRSTPVISVPEVTPPVRTTIEMPAVTPPKIDTSSALDLPTPVAPEASVKKSK